MLKHTINGYVANKVVRSGLPKVKNDDQAAQMFESEFNLSRNLMRLVGIIEVIGAVFLFMSVFGRKFVQIGTILLNIVLGGAIIKHLQAGHGYKGAKSALTLFGLNLLSFNETLRKTKEE
jgi:hypothetical protein